MTKRLFAFVLTFSMMLSMVNAGKVQSFAMVSNEIETLDVGYQDMTLTQVRLQEIFKLLCSVVKTSELEVIEDEIVVQGAVEFTLPYIKGCPDQTFRPK